MWAAIIKAIAAIAAANKAKKAKKEMKKAQEAQSEGGTSDGNVPDNIFNEFISDDFQQGDGSDKNSMMNILRIQQNGN